MRDRSTVRMNLTFPKYFKALGDEAGINFSQELQERLKERLHYISVVHQRATALVKAFLYSFQIHMSELTRDPLVCFLRANLTILEVNMYPSNLCLPSFFTHITASLTDFKKVFKGL